MLNKFMEVINQKTSYLLLGLLLSVAQNSTMRCGFALVYEEEMPKCLQE